MKKVLLFVLVLLAMTGVSMAQDHHPAHHPVRHHRHHHHVVHHQPVHHADHH